MARAVVELAGCSREYGGVRAVAGLDLVVYEGELLSLLGPSGCGKTTTLNLIAGFVLPTVGRVRIDGQDVTDRPAHQRGLGMVFQSYALFPHMNVFENVAFGLRVKRVGRDDLGTRVTQAMRSERPSASAWSWVTKMVVMPTARWISRSSPRISSRSFLSSAASGSSSSSTRGS